jgi:adenosylcobinamide kinase / adenosylcobinamide-phosphate guanylyltransferase
LEVIMSSVDVDTSRVTLVTGAARSGKSEWAEKLAFATGQQIVYVATAKIDPTDQEWQERIEQHRQRRPAQWQTIESAVNVAQIITAAPATQCLLVDSLGTWVANFLEQPEKKWLQEQQQFLESIKNPAARVILVAEETGWGVIPVYELGRLFRDRLGSLIRQVGAIAQPVYLVTGGHALNLSQLGQVI